MFITLASSKLASMILLSYMAGILTTVSLAICCFLIGKKKRK
jgi:hypothetical protein